MNDKYVLEYNVLDKTWNIGQVKDMIKSNTNIFLDGRKVAYIPLAIVDTYEQALEAQKLLEKAKLSINIPVNESIN